MQFDWYQGIQNKVKGSTSESHDAICLRSDTTGSHPRAFCIDKEFERLFVI